MFGSEQSLGMVSFKAKMCYALFGHGHMGYRVRAFHFKKMLSRSDNPCYILDAGCGEGCYTFYLARRFPKARVIGIDINAKLLCNAEYIRQQLGEVGRRISFVEGDLTTHCFNAGFDLIICIDVLEHIVDDERALVNMRDCLYETGKLILHVPQRHQLNQYFFKDFEDQGIMRDRDHVRDEYTEQEILDKVERVGFKVDEVRYTFGPLSSVARALSYQAEKAALGRPVAKALIAPLQIALAYGDSLATNYKRHQGFFFLASRQTGTTN